MSFFNETTQLILRILVIISFLSPLAIRFIWWRKPGLHKQVVQWSLAYAVVVIVLVELLNTVVIGQFVKTGNDPTSFGYMKIFPNLILLLGQAVGYTLFALLLSSLCGIVLRLGNKLVTVEDETVLAESWWNRTRGRIYFLFGCMVVLLFISGGIKSVFIY